MDEFEKYPLHYASMGGDFMQSLSYFFYIFSDNLHVGILIIGLYLVCLITGQALGQGSTI